MRRTLAVFAAVGAALALPATALGHTTLEGASPGTQSMVSTAPTEIRLRFNQPVTITWRAIQVFAPDGTLISGSATTAEGGRVVVAPVSGLAKGSAYTVRWKATGGDGHSPAGVFNFGVGVKPPPPTEAVGARGTTWKDDLARWLLFVSLALLIGPLVLRLVVLRGPVPAELERRFHLVTNVAALLVINVGIAAFVVRASNALQLPFGDLLYGDLQPFAEKTRFGVAFLVMTVGFGAVAALLALAWVFDLNSPRWWALGLALAFASGLSLSGHQATEPDSTLISRFADWLHLVAASVWVGGLVTLAFLVWPVAPGLRARAFLGFSRIAVGLVGAMVLAGVYLALVRLPELADLWETDYGQWLLVKLAIVCVALSWGGFHHLVARPLLAAGDERGVRESLLGETTVAIAVLLAAAVLTNLSPPPVEPASPSAVPSTR